ncbi:unnamed protein product [Urochloa humidicola]
MAIPVARVHLAMAHAALPGLLPTPPKCMTMMMPPPLTTPPCAVTLPSSPPKQPSRADAAERWDAHKVKPGGSPTSPSRSLSGGRRSSDGESTSPGHASSCEWWGSNKNKKKIAAVEDSSSASRTSSPGRSSDSSGSRADSEERWDARKKPAAVMSRPPSSSSSSRSSNKGRHRSKRRPSSRATSSAACGRWDTHKKAMATPRADELDDGKSSTVSNDVESLVDTNTTTPPRPLPQRAFYAGPGFIASPHPSMLPMPSSLMIRVA